MNRTVLAALVVLALPAAALADEHRGDHADRPSPAARSDRRDVAQLERLLARYDEAAASPGLGRELPRLEAELALAFDDEIAEARAALPASRHPARFERGPAYAQLERLLSLKADFTRLQGRYGGRALQAKRADVLELTRIARADLWHAPVAPAPVAWSGHR